MYKKVREYIEENTMLCIGDRILLGLSGGADSVCLLSLLCKIKEEWDLAAKQSTIEICAVHVHHMLRGPSADRDADFVSELCRRKGILLKIYQKDVAAFARIHKMTVEEAGREIRYACFREYAEEMECNKIALAHHEDDQAETVLFRMMRGTGIRGLAAMHPVSGKYIRPLLCVRKVDIINYLKQIDQDYVTDESNGENAYHRNYIRNMILPQMETVNKRAVSHIASIARQASELEDYLQQEKERLMQSCVSRESAGYVLNLRGFGKIAVYLQKEIIRELICLTAEKQKDISAIHVKQVLELGEGRKVNLPYNIVVSQNKGCIHFYFPGKYPVKKEIEAFSYPVRMEGGSKKVCLEMSQGRFDFEIIEKEKADYTNKDCIKCFDYDKITKGMCIRNRRSGDYFVFDQAGHEKSLRRFFIDGKIAEEERDKVLLLADGAHIMWILGKRISAHYKITDNTQKVLQVKFSRNGE